MKKFSSKSGDAGFAQGISKRIMAEYVYGEQEKMADTLRLRSLAGMSFTEKLSVREAR